MRREILANGKSRAFVNDTPVNLKVMRDLGMRLLDIHSQHQTLQINDPSFQLDIIDRFAETQTEYASYRTLYLEHSRLSKELQKMKEQAREGKNELDFIRFQHEELESAGLDKIDEAAIEESFNMLSNAEEISLKLSQILGLLSEGEQPAVQTLAQAREQMDHIGGYAKSYEELADRIKSTAIELDDIAREVERLAGKSESDPEELARINEIRSAIFRLEQKHGVQGVEALKTLRDELSDRLFSNDDLDERIEKAEKELAQLEAALLKAGQKLHDKRAKALPGFSKEIVAVLKLLNMKQAQFEVLLEMAADPSTDGYDRIQMLFSANAGRKPEQLKHVASGGELSRLMLAVKKLSARATQRTTIVFDEIDAGVSGEVADSMGQIMKEMAAGMQVICITHLPQIAAKGTAHFKVYKSIEKNLATTRIDRLEEASRVVEIAQMLSGARTTDAALANARDLLYMN